MGMREERGGEKDIPADKALGFGTELLVGWEMEVAWPIDNLPVRVVRLLGAKGRPPDQALKHDRAH